MMYIILLSSTVALAATHLPFAPFWMTVGVPFLFVAGCTGRIYHWWKSRHVEPSDETVLSVMRRANALSVVIAIAFTAWSLLLYSYSIDGYTRSHVAFYMAITVISCIFCMMYLRSAALIVTAIVNGAFVVFFVATGYPTFIAIAVNIMLVSFSMLIIVRINYKNFERMVLAQQRTEALSNENLRLANIDSLTGLPNRRAFFLHLNERLRNIDPSTPRRLALGIIDLDGFKPVNDLYGHSTGDRLLMEVGERLSNLPVAHPVFVARLGGDEFALIFSAESDEALTTCGEVVCAQLRAPFALSEATVIISGSLGLAVFPDMAASAEELFDRADYALYHGKRSKRGQFTIFSALLEAELHQDARVEQALKLADLDKELMVVFQPIFDVGKEETIGFEALARWTSPVLGFVSPASFIPIAERAGIIGNLTRPLLKKALRAACGWPDHLHLSFNLSAHDINSPEAVIGIVAIIEASGIDARRLHLEITETAFIHDLDQVQQSVRLLRLLGCGILLDDFGTGFSSLASLHVLPLTKIKIDRSFVEDLQTDSTSYKIVKSLLTLSREMGLGCIVEGVETFEQLDLLRDLGAVQIQGYLYSRPLSEEHIRPFVDGTAKLVRAEKSKVG